MVTEVTGVRTICIGEYPKMFKSFILRLAAGLPLLLPAQQVLAGDFTVHGSSTAMQALLSPHQETLERRSGNALNLVSTGGGSGVMDLVAGAADAAVISRPLEEVVDRLNGKRSGSVDAGKLKSHPIGTARVAFAVHSENPVRELRLDQVVDILAGRVDNWQQVGGLDAPIQIVAELPGGGARSIIEKILGARGDVMAPVTTVATAVMAAYAIERLPFAIAVTTDAALDHRVVATTDHGAADSPTAAAENTRKRLMVTDAPIEQPIYLVTYGPPSIAAKRLIRAVRETVKERRFDAPNSEAGTITLLAR